MIKRAENSPKVEFELKRVGAMFVRKVKHSESPSHKLQLGVSKSVELNNGMTHDRGHL